MWLQVLVFLAAAAIVLTCAAAGLIAMLRHQEKVALLSGVLGTTAIALYAAVLLGAGLASSRTSLARGQEKHICEIDCHFAYAVVGVARPQPDRFVVKLRKRFDETTIGSRRGDGPLKPGPRRVILEDASGHRFPLLTSTGMINELRPGESNEAILTFAIPRGARPTKLRLEDGDPVKQLLIGSETSPLHKHVVFDVS